MFAFALFIAAAPSTGTVSIHLTDAHNKAIANHEVWLYETNSTKDVRPFGVQYPVPDGALHGTTNASGDVAIPNVPLRKPMMVVMKFGPRFADFVWKNSRRNGAGMDVMKMEGAVYAGKRAHVILADDYVVSGRVMDESGKPLEGVEVVLTDTGFGHMGAYPGTDLDQTSSDANGEYRFTKLPNCQFLINVKGVGSRTIESRVESGAWNRLVDGQSGTSQYLLLKSSKTDCDFRVSQAAVLTLKFIGEKSALNGWSMMYDLGSGRATGRGLTADPDESTITLSLTPGVTEFWLEREGSTKRIAARRITLNPGESRTIEIKMADVGKT